jgi:hypothetical protein
MDWLEFISSIVGSLVWPGVVLLVLWFNRHRLASLLDFIDELTLPGGAKIKFVKALSKATALLPEDAQAQEESIARPDPVLELAHRCPEAAVVESFIEIVETLGGMVRLLPLPTKGRDPLSVLRELQRLGYINAKTVNLFENLSDAYTAAVRAGYVRLSPEEALRYHEASRALSTQLREVLPRLEFDNPRKKEWGEAR